MNTHFKFGQTLNWTKVKTHKTFQKGLEVFSQGLSPKMLALSISAGVFIGLIPAIGLTTVLMTWISIWLKLNLPIAIFLTLLLSPVQVILFIPFVRIGEWIYNIEKSFLSYSEIKAAFDSSIFTVFSKLSWEIMYGLTGWILVALPISFTLYFILRLVFQNISRGGSIE